MLEALFEKQAQWRSGFEQVLSALSSPLLVAILVLLFGCCFEPASFANLGLSHVVLALHCWRSVVAVAVFIAWLAFGRKDAFSFCTIGLVCIVFISTRLNDGSIELWGRLWLPILIVSLVAGLFAPLRRKEVVWAFFLVVASMSAINLALIFLYPEGLYGYIPRCYYFFGNRTISFEFILPSVACSVLLDVDLGKRLSLRTVAISAMAFFQVFSLDSVTCKLVLVLLVALLVLAQFPVLRRFLNAWTYVGFTAASFVGFVVFRLGNYLEPLIGGLLKKSLTFSGRTEIWDECFKVMDPSHWMIGYGASSYEHFQGGSSFAWHCHNWVLEIWMKSGFLGLSFMFGAVVLSAKRLFENRTELWASVVAAAIASFLFAGLSEPCQACGLYFFIALGWYGLSGLKKQRKWG